ncbi:MAG: AAA family ATPase [Anaerolineae bacterium]
MTTERSAFVARECELAQLNESLDTALAGQGQVCFVTGEAGSGKTALVTEFARRAEKVHPDLIVALGNCSAQTGVGDPYLPFREILALLTGDVEARLAERTISPENANRLRGLLRWSGNALLEFGPDLIDVLVPGVGLIAKAGAFVADQVGWLEKLEKLMQRKAALAGSPSLEQSHIFEQYTNVLRALAAKQPLMLALDDLQWADTSSTSLLFHLSRRIGGSRILLVGTYRPDEVALGRAGERHPLEPVLNELKRYYGDIWVDLSQAAEAEGRQFVDAFLDTEPNRLGEDFRQSLFRHTEGHPLFTIELLRDMRERRDLVQDEEGCWIEGPALDWGELPARVEGVIEERLGRLEAELREVLTVASVEGENFTAEVVARVQAVDERGLVRRLSGELDRQHRLVSARGIRRLDSQRLSLYRFLHSLFHRYVYNSLDEAERAYLHEDVGTALEALYGDHTEEIAVQLARHFQEAAVTDKAIRYLLQAGRRAVRLSAHEEAIGHLARGLELLSNLPDTLERAQQELEFQTALGSALIASKGYTAPEVEQTYARARDLCRQIGETPGIIPVLRGLLAFYRVRADFQTARELAEQFLRLAQTPEYSAFLVDAHEELGVTLLQVGELGPSRAHLEQAIAIYNPQQPRSAALMPGHAPAVLCLSHAAWALWLLGYPDQALKRCQEALILAEELSHPFSIVFALNFAAVLHQFRQERQAVKERSEAVIALSTEHGFPFWIAGATVLQGWALAVEGKTEEGIAQMRQGLAAWQATGAEIGVPHYLALLAEAYGQAGQAEEGLSALAEALASVDNTGQRSWEADLYRLKGELLLMQAAAEADAEACFRQAIQVARQQDAKSWELRATVSLCRLWQKQGKREEARQLLAEVYGWFTEGFDTPDLREAKALLQEFS